jgi:alginate O-acetyltransferase complex protein AlgI
MLFNSAPFLFAFLPVTLSIFFLLGLFNYRALATGWLALASLAFYGWDDPSRLLPIILFSIVFNFIVGWMLLRRKSRQMLAIGICGDLLLLGYFKYAGFLADTITAATGVVVPNPHVLLPIGISFFTFTQIAFLVDAFRGEAQEYKPSHYMLFVTFFPHLIAGPIYHHKEIMPQFGRREIYWLDISNVTLGLTWFALGLAKKVLLADSIAQFATPVFAAVAAGSQISFIDGWIAALSFSLQLYFDFSGYSDMAIGLALLIGVRLPLNFDSPYKSASLIDFWRRWHMTLSRFLRDYLYIPLGGNRRGPRRRYINLMITMLLGGLWHGASWNFVIWGGIHGFGLMINHAWNKIAQTRKFTLPGLLSWALTFAFVVLAWVPFRAETLQATWTIWKSMVGANGFLPIRNAIEGQVSLAVFWIAGLLALALLGPNTQQLMSFSNETLVKFSERMQAPNLKWAAVAGILFGAAVVSIIGQRPTEFLYFRF